MGLTLVGLGVAFDITTNGLEKLQEAQEAYIETYTNPLSAEKITDLETRVNKKIIMLDRSKLESSFLVERAKKAKVVLLVSGDPLIATTHITLVMDAKEKGVEIEVVHNSSIFSVAPAISGLQVYRFGRTATLVNPRPNYRPTSALEIVRENRGRNAHTLVLLDTEPQPMSAEYAVEQLSEFGDLIVISKAGDNNQKITFTNAQEIKKQNVGSPPFVVIVPAKLHIVEEEYLSGFRPKNL
ncbi:diphthine synthase [Candidatus Micrarchaeota archaeon]|nr:diphthine synthase [Candidatus Micrarchaeota archaeon]